jgi:hypothetical protein
MATTQDGLTETVWFAIRGGSETVTSDSLRSSTVPPRVV